KGRTYGTYRQPYRGEDAGEFAHIKRRRRGRSAAIHTLCRIYDLRGGSFLVLPGPGGGKFLELFAYHPADSLVGCPECLTDADRVVDDLHDARVPVPAFPVIKHAVPSDDELVGVACGEC